ncbi:MAG TPA: hypothetical protein VHZ28_06180 [Terracidiphilus sp.]|jgi:hypothetical protein|nr:hypothetical protein [Terracidiphilus sp.]
MAIKFDAEFIERRMEEHRRWQQQLLHALMEEVIDEVQELPKRKPRTARLFEALPAHLQWSVAANLETKP